MSKIFNDAEFILGNKIKFHETMRFQTAYTVFKLIFTNKYVTYILISHKCLGVFYFYLILCRSDAC